MKTISIVVPCYNEEEALPVTAEKLMRFARHLKRIFQPIAMRSFL